jgi:hypothetical protein
MTSDEDAEVANDLAKLALARTDDAVDALLVLLQAAACLAGSKFSPPNAAIAAFNSACQISSEHLHYLLGTRQLRN